MTKNSPMLVQVELELVEKWKAHTARTARTVTASASQLELVGALILMMMMIEGATKFF